MKAAVLCGPRDVRYMDVETPEPGPEDVLVRVKNVGVCGTDFHLYAGTNPFFELGLTRYPLIPGHEWSGVVEQVGHRVTSVKAGDPVVGDVSLGCGKCRRCLAGHYHLCLTKQEVGICGGKQGAYADYVVMPSHAVHVVPANLSFEEAALVDPVATAANAVRITTVEPGDTAAVVGDGPLGLVCAAIAKACGASYVIVVGRSEKRLQVARALGADRVVACERGRDPGDPAEIVEPEVADVVFEAAGTELGLRLALSLARPAGRVAVLGIFDGLVSKIDASAIVLKQLTLFGCLAYPNSISRALALLSAGQIRVEPLITHRFPLSEVKNAFELLETRSTDRIKIMLQP